VLLVACKSSAPPVASPSPPEAVRPVDAGPAEAEPDATVDGGLEEQPALTPPRVERDLPLHTDELPEPCLPGGERKVVAVDLNRDGQPDVHKHYAASTAPGATSQFLACKRVDMDYDGREDYVVTYDERGTMASERFDLTFDGRFDAFKQYDATTGRLVEAGNDTDFDGIFDVFQLYDEAGNLALVTRDRNGDETADYWEVYQHGKLVETQTDDDFDGRIEPKAH